MIFERLFSRKLPQWTPRLAAGNRVYAVGDIHGRLDLLDNLLATIRQDDLDRAGDGQVTVILLGDLIDRGNESAGVVRRAMQSLPWAELVCLKGNHEAAMEGALAGDMRLAQVWLRNGGIDALLSWGVPGELFEDDDIAPIMAEARRRIPLDQQRWLAGLPINFQLGDYFFVHAGIRPGVPLVRQKLDDQLWIREEFLESGTDHGVMVVHGHSMTDSVVERRNRIGIDTGAYVSGRLTAVGLEDDQRWFVQVRVAEAQRLG